MRALNPAILPASASLAALILILMRDYKICGVRINFPFRG